MDFRKIVGNNPEYAIDKLNEKDRAFIDGMQYVVDDCICAFENNRFDIPEEEKTILEKIEDEIVADAINTLKEWVNISICEMVVSMHESEE